MGHIYMIYLVGCSENLMSIGNWGWKGVPEVDGCREDKKKDMRAT